jgi:hypothetical protein
VRVKDHDRLVGELGGFLLLSDQGLAHAALNRVNQGFAESEQRIRRIRADVPIVERRRLF